MKGKPKFAFEKLYPVKGRDGQILGYAIFDGTDWLAHFGTEMTYSWFLDKARGRKHAEKLVRDIEDSARVTWSVLRKAIPEDKEAIRAYWKESGDSIAHLSRVAKTNRHGLSRFLHGKTEKLSLAVINELIFFIKRQHYLKTAELPIVV